jgi:enediyne biosynthesis protein E4
MHKLCSETANTRYMRYFSFFSLLLVLLSACKSDQKNGAAEEQAPAHALLKMVGHEASGLAFVNYIEETYQNNAITNPYLYSGGGVGVIDYDHDGLEDIFLTATTQACKLYKNLGGLKFKDVTNESGINTSSGIKTGVSIVDLNGDGWEDIYICRTGLVADFNRANMAWINQQNGTFKEMAAEIGLNSNAPSNQAAFLDFDLDGDLDMYLLNHPSDFSKVAQVRVVKGADGKLSRDLASPISPDSDRLYRNDNGKYVDVSVQMGIKDVAFGLSVSITDINRDGWPDIVVANDYIEPDIVYVNQRGGKMLDETSTYFAHMSNNSMGADIVDLDKDGYQEFVVMDMLAPNYERQQKLDQGMRYDRYHTLVEYGYKHQVSRNVLQTANGNGGFSEIGCYAGVSQTDWSWGPLGVDFDLDGLTDLFMANGMRRDVGDLDYIRFTIDSIEKRGGLSPQTFPDINEYLNLIPSEKLRNFTYRNTGDLRFEDVSVAWGITPKTFTNGTAYADFDQDGDMDLVLNNINDRVMLFENTAASKQLGKYLNIKCASSNLKNKFALGAKIQARIGDQYFYQEIMPVRGFLSTSTLVTQIGLGAATQVDVLEVEFPGKKLVRKENVAANQLLTITDAESKPGTLTQLRSKPSPVLANVSVNVSPHIQGQGEDFLKQRLLPWRISDVGGCMAVADVNGDGLDDVYLGGGQEQAAQLMIQTASGGWNAKPQLVFDQDKSMLDAHAVFLDVDKDGDADLIVGSGGAQWPTLDAQYQSRLYLNDGKGGFARVLLPLKLPCTALEVIDLDADGDMDVVFAEGHTLENYPLKRGLLCLMNDGKGNFSDGTASFGAQMQALGKVTDIATADLNGDGQPELIAVGEWMPITVWQRNGSSWTNITEQMGLSATHGLWNSLEVADLNGDGTPDLVAGNLGWNTRYRASQDAPLTLYGADFDKNGAQDPVMCFRRDGKDYPFAYRDVMVTQVPAIKKKFIRYSQYAKADMNDLFSSDNVTKAEKNLCNTLETSVFYLKGGKYLHSALPNRVQSSCTYAISVLDVNQDGKPDITLAGNDFDHQTETGRIDSGTGVVLLNQGESFTYLKSADSGFWAHKEARKAQIVKTQGGKQIWIANQNGPVQVFRVSR